MNPFDINTRPMRPEQVEEVRRSLLKTSEEKAASRHGDAWPTREQFGARLGLGHATVRQWRYKGPRGATAALLRIFHEEKRVITPVDATFEELHALRQLVGSWNELYSALGCSPCTVMRWRYGLGKVPARNGYGRLVRLIYEDCIGPPPAQGGGMLHHDLDRGRCIILRPHTGGVVRLTLARLDVGAQAALFLVDALTADGDELANGVRVSVVRGGRAAAIPLCGGTINLRAIARVQTYKCTVEMDVPGYVTISLNAKTGEL